MKIFILTEGSRDAGFGHLSRCTALYQAFEAKGLQPRILVSGDDSVKAMLENTRHEIFDWRTDHERLFSITTGADILVVDSYLAGPELYGDLAARARVPVFIDDNLRLDYPEGIVVNGTVFAERFDYPRRDGAVYLLGSRYAMLRKEFRDVPEKKTRSEVDTVMITCGGDDTVGVTPKILGLLNGVIPELTKKVIVGSGFRNIERIEDLRDGKTEMIYSPDAEGMKRVMLESDIAVSAGGQTLYELARVGVPTISIAVADNQMKNVQGWQEAGFAEYAGWWSDEGALENMAACLKGLMRDVERRERMAESGRRLVDGRGTERIVRECIGMCFAGDVSVREASHDDMEEIYGLSNEADVRAVSFDSRDIPFEEHRAWFLQKLRDDTSLLLVAEHRGGFIGQVRFDTAGNEAVVSISLKSRYRGLGVGRHVLKKAVSYLDSRVQGVNVIKAYIMERNAASLKFFESAGFRFSRRLVIRGHEACELVLKR